MHSGDIRFRFKKSEHDLFDNDFIERNLKFVYLITNSLYEIVIHKCILWILNFKSYAHYDGIAKSFNEFVYKFSNRKIHYDIVYNRTKKENS